MARVIALPQGYLSVSALQLWQDNKERYAQLYFDRLHELRRTSKEMSYGSLVADALEKNEEDGIEDEVTHAAVMLLPKYDIRDKEIRVELKTKKHKFDVLGKLDSLSSETYEVLEYKTGKQSWTQNRVEGLLQLKYYAMLVYLKYGKVPPSTKLVWIQTVDSGDGTSIEATGHMQLFDVTITLADILDTMRLVEKVALEIELAWSLREKKHYDTF